MSMTSEPVIESNMSGGQSLRIDRLTTAAGAGGGRWPGKICSSLPWKTLRSSATCAATASAADSNCASAMPFDLRVVLRAQQRLDGSSMKAERWDLS